MGYDLSMRVWRGDAKGGGLADYTVHVEDGEVVLDAIHRLQATQAGDLAVRWNCKAGKCGSCSAEVNGRPRLMCMTRLADFDPEETSSPTCPSTTRRRNRCRRSRPRRPTRTASAG
jgi:succinate dehydrogenase / fumarate reductase, iron-sulfur subunit